MDTVTQMLFGATVAQAGFRRRLGRRAMVAGALVALVPDLDVVVGWAGTTFDTWEWHRGPTHSVLVAMILGPLFGWLIWLGRRARGPLEGETARAWIYLSVLVLLTHILIDLPTSYGTLALWPLTDHRFAWDGLGIIDVAYSLALVIALVIGFAVRRRPRLAQDSAFAAIIFIGLWTLGGMAINGQVTETARAQLPPAVRVTAYPTLFQPVYRRVVAETPDAWLIGYHSVLGAAPIDWQRFPRSDSAAIDVVRSTERGRLFSWFAMDRVYWTAEPREDGGVLVRGHDLRYGLPGTTLGFWGVQAVVRDGLVVGPVEAFRQRPNTDGRSWTAFFAAVVGRAGT